MSGSPASPQAMAQKIHNAAVSVSESPDRRTRTAAEQFLIQCQQVSNPGLIPAAQFLLEQPRSHPSALYYALTILRESVLRQWSQLSPEQTRGILNRVFSFVSEPVPGRNLPKFVVNAALSTITALRKRDWPRDPQGSRQDFLGFVRNLLKPAILSQEQLGSAQNGGLQALFLNLQQHAQAHSRPNENPQAERARLCSGVELGLALSRAAIEDMSWQSPARLGLLWEQQVACHRAFEREVLPGLAQMSIEVLQAFTLGGSQGLLQFFQEGGNAALRRQLLRFLAEALRTLHASLGWCFLEDNPALLQAVNSAVAFPSAAAAGSSASAAAPDAAGPGSPSKASAVAVSASRASASGAGDGSPQLPDQLPGAEQLRPGVAWTALLATPSLPRLLTGIAQTAARSAEMIDLQEDGAPGVQQPGMDPETRGEAMLAAKLSLRLLLQLASIEGAVLPEESRQRYGGVLLHSLSELLVRAVSALRAAVQRSGKEVDVPADGPLATQATLLCELFSSLAGGWNLAQLLPPDSPLLAAAAALTVLVLGTELAPFEDGVDTWAREAGDQLFEGWVSLIAAVQRRARHDQIPAAQELAARLVDHTDEVVGAYLNRQLGLARAEAAAGDGAERLFEGQFTDDSSWLEEQLTAVAFIARNNTARVLQRLGSAIWERAGFLQEFGVRRWAPGARLNAEQTLRVREAQEQLFWLLRILGHVLADDSSDTPMIPDQLILASKQSQQQQQQQQQNGEESSDPVIEAVKQVFFLASVQLELLNRGQQQQQQQAGASAEKDDFLSPYLAIQLLWWFRRWSLSYLMPDDRVHAMISATIWQAWGEGSEGAARALSGVLQQAWSHLVLWNEDEGVCEAACGLLYAAVENPRLVKFVGANESWRRVVAFFKTACQLRVQAFQGQLPPAAANSSHASFLLRLPGTALENLANALCSGVGESPSFDRAQKQQEMGQLLGAISQQLSSALSAKNFVQRMYSQGTLVQITLALDLLQGAASCHGSQCYPMVFGWIFQNLANHLVELSRKYVAHGPPADHLLAHCPTPDPDDPAVSGDDGEDVTLPKPVAEILGSEGCSVVLPPAVAGVVSLFSKLAEQDLVFMDDASAAAWMRCVCPLLQAVTPVYRKQLESLGQLRGKFAQLRQNPPPGLTSKALELWEAAQWEHVNRSFASLIKFARQICDPSIAELSPEIGKLAAGCGEAVLNAFVPAVWQSGMVLQLKPIVLDLFEVANVLISQRRSEPIAFHPSFFEPTLQIVRQSIRAPEPTMSQKALDTLYSIAQLIVTPRPHPQAQNLAQLIQRCMGELFEMFLFQQVVSEAVVSSAGNALLGIILTGEQQYRSAVDSFIQGYCQKIQQAQGDQAAGMMSERLQRAFHGLLSQGRLQRTLSRDNLKRFRANLTVFLQAVRGVVQQQ